MGALPGIVLIQEGAPGKGPLGTNMTQIKFAPKWLAKRKSLPYPPPPAWCLPHCVRDLYTQSVAAAHRDRGPCHLPYSHAGALFPYHVSRVCLPVVPCNPSQ